jgi:hypothetical protein
MVEIIHVGNTLRSKGPRHLNHGRASVVPIRQDWLMQKRMVGVRKKIVLQQLSAYADILTDRTNEAFSALESAMAPAASSATAPLRKVVIWCLDQIKREEQHKPLPHPEKPLRPDWADGIGRIRGIDAEY